MPLEMTKANNMIGRITGKLAIKQAPEVLVDVNGVGYELQLPMSCFFQLPELGQEVSLITHFVVREDAQLLYGFISQQERALFRELIKVNGIGPKVALAIMSNLSAGQFVAAIQQDDITCLTRCPGVGKKTAERLLVEMKDRLKNLMIAPENSDGSQTLSSATVALDGPAEEAISALVALGYKPVMANKIVKQLAKDGLTSEQLIRMALKSLA